MIHTPSKLRQRLSRDPFPGGNECATQVRRRNDKIVRYAINNQSQ